jgi:hypothetical protein
VQGISKGIAATDANGLIYYEPGTLNIRNFNLPSSLLNSGQKIRVESQKLYVLDKEGALSIYRLP